MSPSYAKTHVALPAGRKTAAADRPALVAIPGGQDAGLQRWAPPSAAVVPTFEMQEFDTWRAERTTLGHGFAFAQLFGHICRYVYGTDTWYVFDGRVWVPDNGEIMARLRLLARYRYQSDVGRLYRLAKEVPDYPAGADLGARNPLLDDATRFSRHVAEKLSTPKALAVMVEAARETLDHDGKVVSLAAHAEDFDTHRHLLAVQNCVINLRDGSPRPHDAALMLSKIAPVVLVPKARAPRFLKAVNRIMGGDRGRVRFLQRVLGYLLTGEASERKVIVFYGHGGNNGKTTVANILTRLLGQSFVHGLPVATLLEKRFGAQEIDVGLTSINGKRVVIAVEPNKGARFNTGVIKALSGNDDAGVMARRPHQRDLEGVKPGAKILLLTNHLPTWEDDQAFNQRFLVVPFEEEFRGADERRDLATELVDAEGPGILNWLLEGARLYYTRGLEVPADIAQQNEEHRLEGDLPMRWFLDCCDRDSEARVPVMTLYASYCWHLRQVLQAPDAEVLSLRVFSQTLIRWKARRVRERMAGARNPVTMIRGIRLRVADGGVVVDDDVAPPG